MIFKKPTTTTLSRLFSTVKRIRLDELKQSLYTTTRCLDENGAFVLKKPYTIPTGRGMKRFPIAVAVSGGADSMAAVVLFHEYLKAQEVKLPLLGLTIDHKLRKESTKEAEQVGEWLDRRGIEHHVIDCDWNQSHGGVPKSSKLQLQARSARYQLLMNACRSYGVEYLVIAHHLGDQLETVLMRLGRAAGINGLAGIESSSTSFSEDTTIIRPFLNYPKQRLMSTCHYYSQEWIEDPSNRDDTYDRVRARKVRNRWM